MKVLLMSLLVAGMQQWVGGTPAPGCDDHAKSKNVYIVKGDKVHTHAHAHAKCCDKPGKCKCAKVKAHKCVCKGKSADCNCRMHGKHKHPGVFTWTTSDSDGRNVIVKTEVVTDIRGDKPHKCKCKSGKCKCHKHGAPKGAGVYTFNISDDKDDEHKVVVRKKCGVGGPGMKLGADVFAFAFDGDSNDGRSEPEFLWIGDDQDRRKNAWLGVSIEGVPKKLVDEFDLQGEGVFVIEVADDSPAAVAGIRKHDVILSIDDDDVNADLTRAVNLIKTRKPGDKVDIVVLRDGDEKEFRVKLGTLGGVVVVDDDRDDGRSDRKTVEIKKKRTKKGEKQGWLGVSIGNVPEELVDRYDDADEGVIILEVVEDSPADDAGLRTHDIILEVDDDDVDASVQKAVELIKKHGPGDKIEIEVLREGKENDFVVKLGDRSAGLLAFGEGARDDGDDDEFDDDFDDEDDVVFFSGDDDDDEDVKFIRAGRGWLGVSIDNVPESLATQLDIEDRGVLVIDVVDGSPADRGGLKVYDIILSVDDDDVGGDTGRAVDLIKARKPGDEVDIVVLRGGDEKELEVELGTRPDELSWTMKHGQRPVAEVEEKIRTRGKILKKGEGGKWIMKDLGELDELEDLPFNIKRFVPKSGKHSIKISADDEHENVSVSVERDGNVIVVAREDGGEITVTRVDDDGKKKTVVYEDEDELRAADEEAFDLLAEADDAMVVHLDVDAIAEGLDDLDFDFEFGDDEWLENANEWQAQLEQGLGEAHQAYEQAMEQFHEAMKQLKRHRNLPKDIEIPDLPDFVKKGHRFPGWVDVQQGGKPNHTFEVRVDGTIEVHLRKGDSEIVHLYEDEDDLHDRSPRLYKKYRALIEVENE
ncbi:MAG: PDZ domain-containing protein [Phycisphaerae bacterium]|jgi:S1-C subfamily serine protease